MAEPEAAGRTPLTLLHLLAPAPFGGLERVVQVLAGAQGAAGHRVLVAAVGASPDDTGPFLRRLEDAGVSARHLEVPPRRYLKERRAVGDLCREWSPDIVHTHGYRSDVVDAGAARSLGIPTVTTVHGFTGRGLKNRVYEWLQRRAFRRFDAVVAVSRGQLPALRAARVHPDRLHLIRNALDTGGDVLDREVARTRLGLDGEAFQVGWVGRLSHEKGPDVLLEAMARQEAGDRDLVVSFVGDGPLADALAARAAELDVADRIRWHGVVPDAPAVLSAFDVLVLSSRTEGTPMVLLEAVHAGTPVVATRVGGVPDVVSDGEARLVHPDDPDALAEAIDDVRRRPVRARERAEAARRRVEADFGVEPWVARYDEVYRGILAPRT